MLASCRSTGRVRALALLVGIVSGLAAEPAFALAVGQIDDFNDATRQGWARGSVELGGPDGPADPYLEKDGSPRLITFNQLQWSGDYAAAGVRALAMDLRNGGGATLQVRAVLGNTTSPNGGGTWYASTVPVTLPPGGDWVLATFLLEETEMTRVEGVESFEAVQAGVVTLRVLHSLEPAARGDGVGSRLGIDNVEAIGDDAPIPTLPPAGLAALALAALATLLGLRRG